MPHQRSANAAAAVRTVDDTEALKARVRELESELAARSAELRDANDETRHLAYVLSHDMREASRMVKSFVQLLGRRYADRLDSDAGEFIQFAVSGVNRLEELLDDLLTYSRVLNSPPRVFPSVSAELALRQALAKLDAAIKASGAVVTHDSLPSIPADEDQLSLLLYELIDNAIKFRRDEPPRVHIATTPDGDDWRFTVLDNGQGIDPRYYGTIFSPFRRLHGREYPGSGMGLAVARKIVERHGGRLWVTPEGRGSAFHFTLRS